MRISDEIDALEVMGLDSVALPRARRACSACGWCCRSSTCRRSSSGIIASYVAVVVQIGKVSAGGYFQMFWMFQDPIDFVFSVVKGMAMATFVVLVGCYYGYTRAAGRSASGGRRRSRWSSNIIGIHAIGLAGHPALLGRQRPLPDRRIRGPSGNPASPSCVLAWRPPESRQSGHGITGGTTSADNPDHQRAGSGDRPRRAGDRRGRAGGGDLQQRLLVHDPRPLRRRRAAREGQSCRGGRPADRQGLRRSA